MWNTICVTLVQPCVIFIFGWLKWVFTEGNKCQKYSTISSFLFILYLEIILDFKKLLTSIQGGFTQPTSTCINMLYYYSTTSKPGNWCWCNHVDFTSFTHTHLCLSVHSSVWFYHINSYNQSISYQSLPGALQQLIDSYIHSTSCLPP